MFVSLTSPTPSRSLSPHNSRRNPGLGLIVCLTISALGWAVMAAAIF